MRYLIQIFINVIFITILILIAKEVKDMKYEADYFKAETNRLEKIVLTQKEQLEKLEVEIIRNVDLEG